MIGHAHDLDGERDVSLLAIDQYFREVHWTPALSQEEEAELFRCIHGGVNALQARERLVEGFQGLVIRIARRFVPQFRHLDLLDVIQEGNIGLLRAIDDHDPESGYPLRALASVYIQHAIVDAWHAREGLVRFPSNVREALTALDKTERQLSKTLGRLPTIGELAQALGVREARVVDLLTWRKWQRVESVEGLLQRCEMEEDRLEFVSLFEAVVVAADWRSERVREAVAQALTVHQREVVRMRYGLAEEDGRPYSQLEVATHYGTSPQAVCTVEQAAHKRLRRVLAASCEIEQPEPVVVPLVSCAICGKMAEQGARRARHYCSAACKAAAYRQRRRQEVA